MLWRYRLRCSSVLGRGMHAGGRPEHRVDHGAHRGTLAVATESAYPNPRGLRPRVPPERLGAGEAGAVFTREAKPRELREAPEQRGDRPVVEHLADRAGDQGGDRQDGEIVEVRALGKG